MTDGARPAEARSPGAALRSRWVWALAAATVALCAAVGLDLFPALRGPLEWRWGLQKPVNLTPWRVAAPLALAALVALWFAGAARAARVSAARLGVLVALALAFRFAVQFTGLHGVEAVGRTMNPAFHSYFAPATGIADVGEFVRSYLARRDLRSFRELTHPPGPTLFFWTFVQVARRAPALTRVLGPPVARRRPTLEPWAQAYSDEDVVAAALAAVAIPAIGCLTLVPLYFLARRLSGPRAALTAIALFVVMPPPVLFLPIVDDLQTFVAVASALLAVEGLARSRLVLMAASGLVLGVGTFLSYSMLPLGGFLLLLVVLGAVDGRTRWREALVHVAVFAAGCSAIWLLVWAFFGLDPLRLFLVSMEGNFNSRERSYWVWLLANPYDLLFFAGLPVAIAFLAGLGGVARRALHRQPRSFADAVAAAFALPLVALFALGKLRGETARTLLYVFPFMAWVAADYIVRQTRLPRAAAVLACGLLVVQTLAFHAFLRVYH